MRESQVCDDMIFHNIEDTHRLQQHNPDYPYQNQSYYVFPNRHNQDDRMDNS